MRWDSRLPLTVNSYFLQLSVPTSSQRRFIHVCCDKYRSTVSETNIILNTTETDTNYNNLQFLSLALFPPAVRSTEDPDLLQYQFSGVSITWLFSSTLFLQIIFNIVHSSFLGLPTDFCPPRMFLNTLFTVLSSDILSTCPNHRKLPFIISEIVVSSSIYRSINS